jgi:hypothetical protein
MLKRTRKGEQGSALLLSTVVSLVILGITGAYLAVSMINTKQTTNSMLAIQALFTAEAGASAYVAALNESIKNSTTPPSPGTFPTSFNGATFAIQDTNPYLTNFRRLYVTGTVGSGHSKVSRSIEVIISGAPGGVFWNAIFAGNSSADPNYTLHLGDGFNFNLNQTVNDQVVGDVYSGGNFSATGTASMNGNIVSAGTHTTSNTTNTTFQDGTTEASLTLPRNSTGQTSWETTAASLRTGTRQDANGVTYIDVAYDMQTMGQYGSWVDNSSATQITDQTQPSHIFREDPTSDYSSANRTQVYEFSQSAKHDFYLEDPTAPQVNGLTLTQPVNGDTTATAVNIQPNGNNAVYFIDGNMRVSGEPIKSYQLNPVNGAGNLSMTFVVKGNVSLTDNILYPTWLSQNDSVAIIAVQDPAYPNTTAGNFAAGTSALLTPAFKGPTGAPGTVQDFVNQFNATATQAQASGHNIPLLDLTTAEGQLRASAEYNKAYGSGNVFYGDPGSGTVEHFEAYMYAENNFYGTDLDSAKNGTIHEEIWGNMTAGNQVNILRTGNEAGYLPLHVFFDPAIKAGNPGTKPPPALPATPSFGKTPYSVLSWRQVP